MAADKNFNDVSIPSSGRRANCHRKNRLNKIPADKKFNDVSITSGRRRAKHG
jgi:hypothetical protein